MARATPAKMVLLLVASLAPLASLAPAFGGDHTPAPASPAQLTELAVAPIELPAQPRPAATGLLPWPEIASRLARRGYVVGDPVSLRGPTYLAASTDRHGRRLRLVVDGRNAEIIGIRVVDGATTRDRPAALPAPQPTSPQP